MSQTCPACGNVGEDDASSCAKCGHVFAAPVADGGEVSPAPAAAASHKRRNGIIAGVAALALIGGGAAWYMHGGQGGTTVDASLLPVAFGGKCGYVDAKGKMAVNPQFDNAEAFDADLGVAPVETGGKWGLIDHDGKYVVNPQFDSLQMPVAGGPILVRTGGKWGTIDATGTFIINPQFDQLWPFFGSHAPAEVGNKWGVIDTKGNFVISPQFDAIGLDPQDLAHRILTGGGGDYLSAPLPVRQAGKWGFVDASGKVIITPQFTDETTFNDNGLAGAAQTVTEKPAAGDDPYGFLAALASVKTKWGLIDKQGKLVLAPQFDQLGHFAGNGLAPVKIGNDWGYIDSKGKITINPQFALAGRFTKVGGNWAAVAASRADNGEVRVGVIDSSGKWLVPAQFDSLGMFDSSGHAIAKTGDKFGLIDAQGHYTLQPVYSMLFPVRGGGGYLFVKDIADNSDLSQIGIARPDGKVETSVQGGVCQGITSLMVPGAST
jgi:hypothetical protein